MVCRCFRHFILQENVTENVTGEAYAFRGLSEDRSIRLPSTRILLNPKIGD